jgi:hypothetical protein
MKSFYILRNGRVVYSPGHYDEDDALRIATKAAHENPRATFKVVQVLHTVSFARNRGEK